MVHVSRAPLPLDVHAVQETPRDSWAQGGTDIDLPGSSSPKRSAAGKAKEGPPGKQRKVSGYQRSADASLGAYERPSQRLRLALEQVLEIGDFEELRRLLHSPYKRPSERLRGALENVLDCGQPLAWDLLFEELRSARWEAASLAKAIDFVQSLLGGGASLEKQSSPVVAEHGQSQKRGSKASTPSPGESSGGFEGHQQQQRRREEKAVQRTRRRESVQSLMEDSSAEEEQGEEDAVEEDDEEAEERRKEDERRKHEEEARQRRRQEEEDRKRKIAAAKEAAKNGLAKLVRRAGKALGEASFKPGGLEALHQHADLLAAGLSQAKEQGLRSADLAEAIECRKEVAKACVVRALDAATKIDLRSIAALKDAKVKLREEIVFAKKHGVSEADLIVAENCRKRFHNAIEDLKGSIRVFCRVRPANHKEAERGDAIAVRAIDNLTLEVDRSKSQSGRYGESEPPLQFAFDSVFNPGTQEEVFEDCRDLLQSAFDGYNVTVFAYGQTGSGKTHTIAGRGDQPGLAPQLIDEIFSIAARDKARFRHRVTASMMELYRNDLVDLLQPVPGGGGSASSSTSCGGFGEAAPPPRKVTIRTDRDGTVLIENVLEEECRDADALAAVLDRGNALRKTAATAMNSESSRSHLILTIKVTRTNRETGAELKGKIMLVDLAGSERLKKSLVTGDAQKEAIEINKSLTALGDVIEALTQGQPSVPYRNHKLTQVLQDSLGRTAKTLMFVHCAPTRSNIEETVASLKYAARAKRITPGSSTPRGSLADNSASMRPSLVSSAAAAPPAGRNSAAGLPLDA
eukprot:TRINITY_DN34024_c0_g1_i1.p1 TRINITY_DN34024_c0_g1~~TRINITY_DN34024_c0_g1_i1.p1  ORF type:complete len:803 (+),score=255.61 TRINITY_DN34024_c0_g1_i1:81-2489(+)